MTTLYTDFDIMDNEAMAVKSFGQPAWGSSMIAGGL
jgi:hypothetical protein